ncbi:MAG: hypothetical protein JRF63_11665 [Deltaproteobacteria bacterium]|nr:hypothetical protein [Deltaproteobacteria bacterium]
MPRALIALLAAVAAVGLAAAGCGDDDDSTDGGADSGGDTDTDTDTDTDSDPGPDIVTATITVPTEFEAVPDQLVAYFHQWYPPAGDPAATAGNFTAPEIGPGTPFALEIDHAGLTGAYYLWVVLYIDGGGAGVSPVQGVDWIGGSSTPLTLGPGEGTNDLGTIQLDLYL